MEFNPRSPIIQLCVQAIALEEKGQTKEADEILQTGWKDATTDLEKFVIAYQVAKIQTAVQDQLQWFRAALEIALNSKDTVVGSALPTLYSNIASSYEQLGDASMAEENNRLASSLRGIHRDAGPFYHGTKADLQAGDSLTAGRISNYKSDFQMNHVYFTGLINGAGLAAALAKGEGRPRVYIVEPTGAFEDDPNVTDKKFPGNLTRSYRTMEPLKIVGELPDWDKLTPGEITQWQEKLAKSNGEIIN